MEYLYKYTSHNKDYKYEIIKNSYLWFSKIESFNDPIDSRLDYKQEYSEDEIKKYWENFCKDKIEDCLQKALKERGNNKNFIEQQNRIFEEFRKNIGVLCFSINPKNILMWSHYANSHKGIVYEFKSDLFQDTKTTNFDAFPYKVDYPCNRSYDLLSYTLTGKEKDKQFVTELLTKAKDWGYEEEYRMIDLENSGNKSFKKESLKSIIFGARTEDIEIDIMKYLCNKYDFSNVKFKKAQFIKGKFEIEIVDI